MDYQKLGKRIRSLRAQEEMTQDQLGEAAGYTGCLLYTSRCV